MKGNFATYGSTFVLKDRSEIEIRESIITRDSSKIAGEKNIKIL